MIGRMLSVDQSWQASVPGFRVNQLRCDPATASVFVSDGWGVAHAGLRLHRLSLESGEHQCDVRTRHQPVSAMTVHDGDLFAATDSRLFQFDPRNLAIKAQWDAGLVKHCQSLVAHPQGFVMSNWLKPTIGLFDRASGTTGRLKVGPQPIVLSHAGELVAISGRDGSIATLDPTTHKLKDRRAIRPVANAAAGRDIWGTLAGPPDGQHGVAIRRPTATVVRLTGSPMTVDLPSPIGRLAIDDEHELLWAMAERAVYVLDQSTGRIVGDFALPPDEALPHVDIESESIFTFQQRLESEKGLLTHAESTLTRHVVTAVG